MQIEIYGRDNCNFCDLSVLECEKRNLNYSIFKLNEDFSREEMLEKFPNAKTYPQITVDNKLIGGYTEFRKFINDND